MQTETVGSSKLPLDDEGRSAVSALAKWLRITGSAQLGIASIGLAMVGLVVGCGMLAVGGEVAALISGGLIIAIVAVYVLQALRTQAAGEQFGQIAEDADMDGLEFGFARLRTVFIIDAIVGGLLLLLELIGVFA